jgi:hypothetical protein
LSAALALRLGNHFVVMLTEQWRSPTNPPPRFIELVGCAKVRQLPGARMGDLDEKVPDVQVLLGGELSHSKHGRKVDPLLLPGSKEICRANP